MNTKRVYTRLSITEMSIETESPILAASALENSVIQASAQEVEYVNFADDSSFDVTWK